MKSDLDKLRAIIEASKKLTSVLDLDDLLNVILDVALQELEAERGTVYLLDKEENELVSRILRGDEIDEIRLPLGQGISGCVAENGEALIIPDAYADRRFNRDFDRQTGFRTKSVLCAPLIKGEGEILGVIQLLNKKEGEFKAEDIEYLEALAAHMVIAVENAKAHLQRLEQERTRKELELAAQIQQRFLPQAMPRIAGVEIDARAVPSFDVGGDYYNFLELPGGRLVVVIADVSGHGIGAALITAAIHAYLHALIGCYENPAQLATQLNGLLYKSTLASKYATMALVEIDPGASRLRYCNCGHNPLILFQNGGMTALRSSGTIVGMFPKADYGGEEIELNGGERLLLYTDGVTEAARGVEDEREEFGFERLVKLSGDPTLAPAAWLDRILGALDSFCGGQPAEDDITMVALRLTGIGK
jgi:sigma-B regulation protein RsbU (phosphoserine phosphatase)